MNAEIQKYTREQVDALEVAPGFAHENLEGWVPELATSEALNDALEKAFDYRGDVTLTLKSGERIEAYIFNRQTGATLVKLPIMPGGVPNTGTYIEEMDYIVHSFVDAVRRK